MLKVLIAVFIMAVVTYLPRVAPLAIFKNKIRSRFIAAFLGYVPFAVLGAMIFPDILYSTGNMVSAVIGLITAVILAYFGKSLLKVAIYAIAAVYICELVLLQFTNI